VSFYSDPAPATHSICLNQEICVRYSAIFGSHHYKTDLSCFLWIRFLLCHLLPMRNRGSCTQWQICLLQVSISIFAIYLLLKGIEHSDDIWSWPFYVRLLQLLVLACALAELTWPEYCKRRQLFRYWFCKVVKLNKIKVLCMVYSRTSMLNFPGKLLWEEACRTTGFAHYLLWEFENFRSLPIFI